MMDTVTHALFGAAISDCGFRKRLGPLATPFSLVAAASPDMDVLAYFVSSQAAWTNHRGYTHAFLTLAIAGPVLGGLGRLLSRRPGTWFAWTVLAWLCLFSHTLLDLATSWGTMPYLPFSNARVSWDILPIIDVFMSAVPLSSFVVNRMLRWEWTEHFLNPLAFPVVHEYPRRRRIADIAGRTAVALVVAYFAVGWLQNRQTVRIAREELAEVGFRPVETRALPIMFTFIAYEVIARDASGEIRKANYSSWAPKRMEFAKFPAPKSDLFDLAMNTPEGRLFSWYSQGMVGALPPIPDGDDWRFILVDRRFAVPSDPGQPRFVMKFAFDSSKRVVAADAVMAGFQDVDIGDEILALWRLTRYGDVRERR